MQITIQKKFLLVVEIAENVYRLFVVVVNFVFNFVEKQINNFIEKTFNYLKALFGYNIYKLRLVKIKTKTIETKNSFANNDFLIYSNLLAPPIK
jgi:hypothetical protein